MKTVLFLFVGLLVSVNVLSAQTKEEKKALKKQKALEQYTAAKELINSGSYAFDAQSATTQKGKRINLISNPNSLVIINNIAKADLPYFGVAQNVPYGGSDGGINFEGEMQDYQVNFDDKKNKATIRFKAKNNSESFSVILTIYSSDSASLSINSNNRNSINYDGTINPVEK